MFNENEEKTLQITEGTTSNNVELFSYINKKARWRNISYKLPDQPHGVSFV